MPSAEGRRIPPAPDKGAKGAELAIKLATSALQGRSERTGPPR
jgi:hypothetical protein